jgi:hypothetical protein
MMMKNFEKQALAALLLNPHRPGDRGVAFICLLI